MSQPITIQNQNGQRMFVQVNPAENASDTVLIHHGYGGSSKSPVILRLAQLFNAAGFTTVVPDTTNNVNAADGDIRDFTFARHALDLQDVHDWGLKQSWHKGRMHVAGYSLGGFSAIALLRARPDVASGLLVAPVLSRAFFDEGMEAGSPGLVERWKNNGKISFTNDIGISFQAPYPSDNESYDGLDVLAPMPYSGPVTLVRAGMDALVQDNHIQAACKIFADAALNVCTIAGEDHFFEQRADALEIGANAHISRLRYPGA